METLSRIKKNKVKKKPLNKEQENHAAILNGIMQGYGLDKALSGGGDRKWRRIRVKYFWFPLYVAGNPLITIYAYYTGHWIIGTLWALYTIYGYGKMFYGDRFTLFLLRPFLRIISKQIFKK